MKINHVLNPQAQTINPCASGPPRRPLLSCPAPTIGGSRQPHSSPTHLRLQLPAAPPAKPHRMRSTWPLHPRRRATRPPATSQPDLPSLPMRTRTRTTRQPRRWCWCFPSPCHSAPHRHPLLPPGPLPIPPRPGPPQQSPRSPRPSARHCRRPHSSCLPPWAVQWTSCRHAAAAAMCPQPRRRPPPPL